MPDPLIGSNQNVVTFPLRGFEQRAIGQLRPPLLVAAVNRVPYEKPA